MKIDHDMFQNARRIFSGFLFLLVGGFGLWLGATKSFEEQVESLPDYDWLAEIRGLSAEGRLGEAEELAGWVLDGSDITNRAEVAAVRDEVHKKRTAFWNRFKRAAKGFFVGDGTSIEELSGAIVSDFFSVGRYSRFGEAGLQQGVGEGDGSRGRRFGGGRHIHVRRFVYSGTRRSG